MKNHFAFLFLACCLLSFSALGQQITGVWKGKIDKKKVEIKIIQKGDSLIGTSYYYESANNYSRYSIKGYFDQINNSVVWWDDQLLEEKNGLLSGKGKGALLSVADFNCPGGGEMFLNGDAAPVGNRENIKGPVDLTKVPAPLFNDEWNYVLRNYTIGANHPDIIDSVSMIAGAPIKRKPETQAEPEPITKAPKRGMVSIPPIPTTVAKVEPVISKPLTIEEKFTSRKKVFIREIPLAGDSIELRFYDNAEVDGDSISLFLNNRLLFQHIRLTDKAYTIKLPVTALLETNELTMVAENLGSIPPNTSFMVAIVNDKRYEAMLASTENSSAVIRLYKPPVKSQ
jgi:hypothetical protein